jgi:hypothetical protein
MVIRTSFSTYGKHTDGSKIEGYQEFRQLTNIEGYYAIS